MGMSLCHTNELSEHEDPLSPHIFMASYGCFPPDLSLFLSTPFFSLILPFPIPFQFNLIYSAKTIQLSQGALIKFLSFLSCFLRSFNVFSPTIFLSFNFLYLHLLLSLLSLLFLMPSFSSPSLLSPLLSSPLIHCADMNPGALWVGTGWLYSLCSQLLPMKPVRQPH